jgi:hypothetical protein
MRVIIHTIPDFVKQKVRLHTKIDKKGQNDLCQSRNRRRGMAIRRCEKITVITAEALSRREKILYFLTFSKLRASAPPR